MRLALVLALLIGSVAAPATAAERWRWPVRGEILTRFHVTANPFAGGQHRGVDIAARPGAPVVAACGGRVRFAGRLPGRGRAVSVECGALVATHLELSRVWVRTNDRVAAGSPIGRVAASHVQLGARRIGRRHGYLDPVTLLAEDPAPPPGLAPPPRRPEGRLPRPSPLAPRPATPLASRPFTARVESGARGAAPAAAPLAAPSRSPHAPVAAWVGVALLGVAAPVGGVVRRRRARATVATALVASEPP